MPIELKAHTEAGARLVAIADKLFPQLASTSRGAGLKDFRFDDLRHHRGATMALDYFGDSAR